MTAKYCLLAFAALSLAGCAVSGDYSAAEKQVGQFHSLLDAGNFHDIYVASAPEMKKSDSEEKLDAFLGAVHRKLGMVKSSKQVNSGINVGTGGTFVTLLYKTSFAEGDATEKFVYM